MKDEDLALIVADPDLADPATGRVLLALALDAARGDVDIAGDVALMLTERLLRGSTLRDRLATHNNPSALLTRAAVNAARDAWSAAGRNKRVMPLTVDGDLVAVEPAPAPFSPTMGLFDVLTDLGWTTTHLEMLAIPRKRPGRSVHPGIEAGLEKLAACYGVTTRCPGCPSEFDLLRLDLRGPDSWPHLVPVLHEWGWADAVIAFITTSPANIGQWRSLDIRPPARQERRMVEIARKMRVEPWLLQDSQAIRDSIKSAASLAPRLVLAPPDHWGSCQRAS